MYLFIILNLAKENEINNKDTALPKLGNHSPGSINISLRSGSPTLSPEPLNVNPVISNKTTPLTVKANDVATRVSLAVLLIGSCWQLGFYTDCSFVKNIWD